MQVRQDQRNEIILLQGIWWLRCRDLFSDFAVSFLCELCLRSHNEENTHERSYRLLPNNILAVREFAHKAGHTSAKELI
jgi:hypothetical protein